MNLMISYSRDDKAWVYEFAEQLKEYHHVWIDKSQLVGGADWWEGICEGIENAECIIAVLTPKSVGSTYCEAEVNYALALNKPILPLMLKAVEIPEGLQERNIQVENVEILNIDRTLVRCERAFGDIAMRIRDGEYESPWSSPERPPVPEVDDESESEQDDDFSWIEDHKERAQSFFLRGIRREQTDIEGQIYDFTKATTYDPSQVDYHLLLGSACKDVNPSIAILAYNAAIRLDPQRADAYYFRGAVYATEGMDDLWDSDRREEYQHKAVQDYQMALKLAPNHQLAEHMHQYIQEHGR